MTVVAGPNGSGKTTLTKQLLAHAWTAGATYINPDEIARDRFGDWNAPGAVRQAAVYADRLRARSIQAGDSFAYETVFSTPRRLEDLRTAGAHGFFVRFFFVSTEDPAINISRVRRRVEVGGHDVPEDKIVARYHRSMHNLLPALRVVDRGYVFDNSVDDRDPVLVLRTVNGAVQRTYGQRLPDWAALTLASLKDRPDDQDSDSPT